MTTIPQYTCEQCGKVFTPPHRRKYGRVFCSRRCMGACRELIYRGTKNPKWRGGVTTRADGRRLITVPRGQSLPDRVLEYRVIAAETIGRPLTDDEIVHHVNGDVTDNAPSNLQVMTQAEHAAIHAITRRRNAETGRFL